MQDVKIGEIVKLADREAVVTNIIRDENGKIMTLEINHGMRLPLGCFTR